MINARTYETPAGDLAVLARTVDGRPVVVAAGFCPASDLVDRLPGVEAGDDVTPTDDLGPVEILINNGVVRKYILEGREGELREVLNSIEARQVGMIDFNDALVELVEKEYIHMRTALESSPNVDELNMKLKKLK